MFVLYHGFQLSVFVLTLGFKLCLFVWLAGCVRRGGALSVLTCIICAELATGDSLAERHI